MVTVEHLNSIDGWAVKICGQRIGTPWATRAAALNGNGYEDGASQVRQYIATNIRAAMEPRKRPAQKARKP